MKINIGKAIPILIILSVLLSACTKTNINSNNKQDEQQLIKVVSNFKTAIKNRDEGLFKDIMAPSGLIVIRHFVSGSNSRGKNIRDVYTKEKLPSKIEFAVPEEIPIIPSELFYESLKTDNIAMNKIDKVNFSFEGTENAIPSTQKIIETLALIQKNTGNNDAPEIITLGTSEFLLKEGELIDDMLIGSFAIFEKSDKTYFLRAIIDLR